MTFTTGRSAEPTPIFFTQHDMTNLATGAARIVEVCAAQRDKRMLNTLPFAPHLAFWVAHYAGTAGGLMTLSSGGGKVMGTEGNLRFIRMFKPDVIIGVPTFVYHLLHQAAEEGMHCENLRWIVLGGEKVSDGLRQKLRDLTLELGATDVAIVATYGFTEAKQAWPECPLHHGEVSGGYHLYPDLGIKGKPHIFEEGKYREAPYLHKVYPKAKYHRDFVLHQKPGKEYGFNEVAQIVNSAEEEAKLGAGWADTRAPSS
jgi:phenylacetate-coenzyme A ligase PaaK-like adenylate-forming protein